MGKTFTKQRIKSLFTTASDGYVIAEEVWFHVGKNMEDFKAAVNEIADEGFDIVDEAYEDIYREKRNLDADDTRDEVLESIIQDLEKTYQQKIENGVRSYLADAGFTRGVYPDIHNVNGTHETNVKVP